jgi:hypothetical protein
MGTRRESVSLRRNTYKALIESAGLGLRAEYDDEGGNHYYEATKPRGWIDPP